MRINFKVNGRARQFEGDPETPLLWVLRDHLHLTGTKYGCGIARCGACTVHLDGRNRRACVTPIASVAGREVTTIEGAAGPVAEAVKAAWIAGDTPQCGFCQPGQVMSAIGLLKRVPTPDDAAIDAGMAGNICRCATYQRIRKAIKDAATALETKA
jgi:isoquinoline 1-oxidoreductase alpha subunit